MNLYCCGCQMKIEARLTDGHEIYPRRPDLHSLPFWKCDACGNYVGCHHKTKNRTQPLGVIPTVEIKKARQHIHALIDPVWKSGAMKRSRLYAMIGNAVGRKYHTAQIRSIDEARTVYLVAKQIIKEQTNAE